MQLLKAALRTYNRVQQGLISSTETFGFGDVIFFLSFVFSYLRIVTVGMTQSESHPMNSLEETEKCIPRKRTKAMSWLQVMLKLWDVVEGFVLLASLYLCAFRIIQRTSNQKGIPKENVSRKVVGFRWTVRDCICFALLSSVSLRLHSAKLVPD